MNNEFDILIVGAGASGLMAAKELAIKGRKTAILEARDYLGGRIHTVQSDNFSNPIETGAEFVHGSLPLTRSLLKEAHIHTLPLEGETYHLRNGKLQETNNFIDDFPALISKLKGLKHDMTLAEFLENHLNDQKYKSLRESVKMYAEGYDASDISRVSTFALREEWTSEMSSESYRIKGGYSRLIDFLADGCRSLGCKIHLSTVVKEIRWNEGHAEVISEAGKSFSAGKVLITVPLGVLLSEPGTKGHIRFSPGIPEIIKALGLLGFGAVVKLFLEFKDPFWEGKPRAGENIRHMPDLDFILSDAQVPTWWTQLPEKTPLLTGWLAGPKALVLKDIDNDNLALNAIESLSYIFGIGPSFLLQNLTAKRVVNWSSDPFSLGAYSYATVDLKRALEVLTRPVNDTLYFAGEAVYEGSSMGTVEAALNSGKNAALMI